MSAMTHDFAAYQAHFEEVRRFEQEIQPQNKTALFDALQAAGVHSVTVTFDGSGDSGQIEAIDAVTADDNTVDLGPLKLPYKIVDQGRVTVTTEETAVVTVIEAMSYDFLGQTHCGWGNDDGAYGDFTFNVPDRTITLDYNERFTDSTNYSHKF